MPHKREFAAVLEKLNLWRDEVLVQLRDPLAHAETLTLKLQLDAAIAALEFCERHQIRPEAPVTVLPDLKTQSPSSAFRIAEDHESDNKANWVELEINDWHLELSPGDIIIEQGRTG